MVENLILKNLSLVNWAANRICRYVGGDYEDLCQAGRVGLVKAARKFDALKKNEFGSYAVHRIRGEILDHIDRQNWAPRRLVRKREKLAAIRNCDFQEMENFQPQNSSTESVELKTEIADLLNTLTGRERRVILLSFYNGFFGYEIADKMGISAGLVSIIKAKALGKLKARIS